MLKHGDSMLPEINELRHADSMLRKIDEIVKNHGLTWTNLSKHSDGYWHATCLKDENHSCSGMGRSIAGAMMDAARDFWDFPI